MPTLYTAKHSFNSKAPLYPELRQTFSATNSRGSLMSGHIQCLPAPAPGRKRAAGALQSAGHVTPQIIRMNFLCVTPRAAPRRSPL
ncbi:hypothetical protein EVAR_37690_1 [Eumeta japonica]|uniref:Uncharacterized protein n=1 Tax=Eumeta variegata TaxID=151549 RepID=A0A4C1XSL6_EUMVA|nr:hypothetical protein EVAR_37690_1 [Eumeta japonica]